MTNTILKKRRLFFIKTLLLLPFLITTFSNYLYPNNYKLENIETLYCLLLIVFIGIPHGAMDHIIFTKEIKKSKSLFNILYWLIGISNAILWILFPIPTTLIFLIISAFHFGQGKLSKFNNIKNSNILFALWGMTIISFWLSKENILVEIFELTNLKFIDFKIISVIFFTATISTMLVFLIKKKVNKKLIFKELVELLGILSIMYFTNHIVGFTIFFIFIHSFEVLKHEFDYLKLENKKLSIKRFISKILPFSILSYLFIFFLFCLKYFNFIRISELALLIILLSSITLPHTLVMSLFYKNKFD